MRLLACVMFQSYSFLRIAAAVTLCTAALSTTVLAQETAQPDNQNIEFRYISDDLFTYMRAGPGPDFRLLGSVTAGAKIQLLQVDRDAGYAEIIDDRQRTGWIEIKYVSRTPTIREELMRMSQEVSDKTLAVSEMQAEVDAIKENLGKSEQQKISLNRQITQHLEKIGELNERLEQRERANQMQWFTRGASLGVVSLFIGYLMGLFGRKKQHGDRLM